MSESPYTLDNDHLNAAAGWAIEQIRSTGHAHVVLTPGDATRYEFVIVVPVSHWNDGSERTLGAEPSVSLVNFGTSYPWNGYHLDASYAAEKWGRDNIQTGRVVAAFLNRVAVVV